MSNTSGLENCVRQHRTAKNWSQQDLAERAGIARASVSAIEMGRLIPSAAAALALAAALECRVEELFQLASGPGSSASQEPLWAWQPGRAPTRYWKAEIQGRQRLYPLEATYCGTLAHDGLFDGQATIPRVDVPPPTLVMACCDPAVGLLASELAKSSGIRLLPLVRSSRAALDLLNRGLVHAAGLHLGPSGSDDNAVAVGEQLGAGYRLVRVADWEEGIVTPAGHKLSSLGAISKSRLRWVGREPGSGARQCLEEVLGTKAAPQHIAQDHRGVAEAVRAGWADAGICLRMVGEEASLQFLPVRTEAYDVCFPEAFQHDSRIRALLGALRSTRYRDQLDDLPGYNVASGDDFMPPGDSS